MSVTSHDITPGYASEVRYVKWNSPVEELTSIARFADDMCARGLCERNETCIAVPNLNWARQLRRTLDKLKIGCNAQIPVRVSKQGKIALMTLEAICDMPGARERYLQLGATEEQVRNLSERYRATRGLTLAHASKIDAVPEFKDALRHVVGDEDGQRLAQLLRDQLAHPTIPQGMDLITVAHYKHIEGHFENLFIVGCVNGLIPGPAAFSHEDEEESTRVREEDRLAFRSLIGAERTRTILSGFTKVDIQTADAAHLPYKRTKMEDGEKLAMVTPSDFLADEKGQRPTTDGGQALLKIFRLN